MNHFDIVTEKLLQNRKSNRALGARCYPMQKYNDGFCICWSDQLPLWELYNDRTRYYFELPNELYEQWERYEEEKRAAALRLKQDYMSKVVLFHNRSYEERGKQTVEIIHLSEQFMRDAEERVRKDKQDRRI
ncbi:MAG: hypothetical protein LIO86_10365 [Lachnospiraceae bacterium]|nr:hypothetical protein [Lachnospiraceae bacterium]